MEHEGKRSKTKQQSLSQRIGAANADMVSMATFPFETDCERIPHVFEEAKDMMLVDLGRRWWLEKVVDTTVGE
ncbi:hypothetical protein A2U01_0066537 [Trifolium medium]|uniref:Uncharacterized protein n=1 Tax=Trifolium medium TaxID=97028 RepID=A0A392S8X7_9FABA|nr:hypothetical protein [Trifolium medium]